jgi:hypothetical protein
MNVCNWPNVIPQPWVSIIVIVGMQTPELGNDVVNDLLLLLQMMHQKRCNCKHQYNTWNCKWNMCHIATTSKAYSNNQSMVVVRHGRSRVQTRDIHGGGSRSLANTVGPTACGFARQQRGEPRGGSTMAWWAQRWRRGKLRGDGSVIRGGDAMSS